MELTSGIHLVASGSGGFYLTHEFDCHVYLLDGGSEAALVDTGIGRATDELIANVRRAGVDPDRLSMAFLTHGHADHSGGAAELSRRLPNLRVAGSPRVARWVSEGDERALSLASGMSAGLYPAHFSFEPCEVGIELVGGTSVRVGSLHIEVIDTPGHSDGHLALRLKTDRGVALFSGDLLFFGGQISLLNNWDCRIQDYADSVVGLEGAGVNALLPGHHFIALKGGQRHIDAAARSFRRGLVPKSVI